MRHVEPLAEIEKLEHLCRAGAKVEDIEDCVKQAVSKLGFDYFSIAWFSKSLSRSDSLTLTNFPVKLAKELCLDEASFYHPINMASQRSLTGVRWSEVGNYVNFTESLSLAMERVYASDLTVGFTVFYPLPRGFKGIFAVAHEAGPEVPREVSVALYYLGASIFQIFKTIQQAKIQSAIPPNLSPREKACVELIAQGHSDPEIASILYLSPETIRDYVSSARARLNVRRRGQLVYECIRQGLLDCPRWNLHD